MSAHGGHGSANGGGSGGGKGELGLDKESLRRITEGLRAAVGELRSVGTSTGATIGSGFGEFALSGMEAGHPGLAGDFEGFCERWEWGVRSLVQDANRLAAAVGLSAGAFWEEEQYRQGAFKVTVNALVGNPHLGEDEVEKKSWGEVFAEDTYTPDHSPASFRQAGEDAAQAWKDTGRSVATEGHGGTLGDLMADQSGVSEDDRRRAVDEAFGPSPEERAAQAAQPPSPDVSGGGH